MEARNAGEHWRTHHVATIRKVRNRLSNIDAKNKRFMTQVTGDLSRRIGFRRWIAGVFRGLAQSGQFLFQALGRLLDAFGFGVGLARPDRGGGGPPGSQEGAGSPGLAARCSAGA